MLGTNPSHLVRVVDGVRLRELARHQVAVTVEANHSGTVAHVRHVQVISTNMRYNGTRARCCHVRTHPKMDQLEQVDEAHELPTNSASRIRQCAIGYVGVESGEGGLKRFTYVRNARALLDSKSGTFNNVKRGP